MLQDSNLESEMDEWRDNYELDFDEKRDHKNSNFDQRFADGENFGPNAGFMDKGRLTIDDKLELYRDVFERKNKKRRDEIENRDEQDQLEYDLKILGIKVNAYSSRRLTKIKRMGLTKIKKSFLQ